MALCYCMINYTLHFEQDRIHNWWHSQYTDTQQVLFYHRYYAYQRCYPPNQPNTSQFEHFWNWFSAENPTIVYTRYTQQAIEDLNNALSVTETWDAVYLIIFSIQYLTEPKPYIELRQDIYNAFVLTESFQKDPFEELYQISEVAQSTYSDSFVENFEVPNDFRPLLADKGPVNFRLLFTKEDLNLADLFEEETVGLLYTHEDLYINALFREELVGLLITEEDLNLNTLFPEELVVEVPGMAAIPGEVNMNVLLN